MPFTSKSRWLALLPALVVLIAVLQQLPFLLPSIHDTMTESYEPAKTLRFVAMHGNSVHKWGPLPNFFYAPAYAVVLAQAKLTHHLGHLNGTYPFGFDDPVQQIGRLIFAGRLVVLVVALLSIVVLTWTLMRCLHEPRVALVVMACLTTSIVSLEPWTDTKPDGFMVAMLILALAGYTTLVLRGLSVFRAIGTALFYVASLSCKELTATSMFLPFAGMAIGVWLTWRTNKTEGGRQLRALLAACLAVPVFYLLFNVIYAPHAWFERMHYVFGPLKDPSIWAAPGQTHMTYLRDTLESVGAVLGWGGLAVLAVAALGTLLRPDRKLIALWLPFFSHLIFTTLSAGYMPHYFMLPVAPMLCLPGSYVVARWLKRESTVERMSPASTVVAAVATCLCLYLGLNAMAMFRESHRGTLIDRAFLESTSKGSTVNVLELWTLKRTGPTSGLNQTVVDHRPAFVLAGEPRSALPQYIFVDRDMELWMKDFHDRPARAALLKGDTGYDYSQFPGVEKLGYDLSAVTVPHYAAFVVPALVVGGNDYRDIEIKVFRLHEPPGVVSQ